MDFGPRCPKVKPAFLGLHWESSGRCNGAGGRAELGRGSGEWADPWAACSEEVGGSPQPGSP